MEDTRTLLQKIDDVLIYLKNKSKPPYLQSEDITSDLLKDLNMNRSMFLNLLDKLIIDRYVEYGDITITKYSELMSFDFPSKAYMITFEGEFFLESVGGYVKQAALNLAESKTAEKLASDQRVSQTNTEILTRWIAFGAIVASVYYLIEIYKLVHHFFYVRELYWIWEVPKP